VEAAAPNKAKVCSPVEPIWIGVPIEAGLTVMKMLATIADDHTAFELPWQGGGMLSPSEALESLYAASLGID
jgi:hypothetical protein